MGSICVFGNTSRVYEAGPPSFRPNSLLVNNKLFYVKKQFRIVDDPNSQKENKEEDGTLTSHR